MPQRSLESLAPRLVGLDGKPLLKNGVIDEQAVDDYLSEEELLDGDEADMSILPQEVTLLLSTCFSCDTASLLQPINKMLGAQKLFFFFFSPRNLLQYVQ